MTAEKIEAFWQDATADDVARVMAGDTVEARFRDSRGVKWVENRCSLAGWCAGVWTSSSGLPWQQCQVYREPFWYANKPDPGPGYMLLGKFPDQEPKPGDECFGVSGVWGPSCQAKAGGHQVFGIWYRRRIDAVEAKPVKPEEGNKCPMQGCSGVLRFRPVTDCACHIKPPCSHCEDNPPSCSVCEWTTGEPIEPVEAKPRPILTDWQCREGDTYMHPNGLRLTITEKGFEVTQ